MPFYVEPLSFGIGFFIGVLFWILLGRMRPAFKEWREGLSARREESQATRSSGVEENHRRITLRRAQGMHLASPLFALDEILQPPVLIAPPARTEPGISPLAEDIVSPTLPYLPAWPELATIYGAPSLSVPKALSGGGNIVLIGWTAWEKLLHLPISPLWLPTGIPNLANWVTLFHSSSMLPICPCQSAIQKTSLIR